MLPTRSVL